MKRCETWTSELKRKGWYRIFITCAQSLVISSKKGIRIVVVQVRKYFDKEKESKLVNYSLLLKD